MLVTVPSGVERNRTSSLLKAFGSGPLPWTPALGMQRQAMELEEPMNLWGFLF